MKKVILVFIFMNSIFSCKDVNQSSYDKKNIKTEKTKVQHVGKKLMEKNCNVCHSPTASHNNRVAPPMVAIKRHYISSETTKEEFIASIQNFIKNPTEETAKLHGAVKRFGVMPKQAYPEKTIKQIAEYLFENDIEKPAWFESHFNEKNAKKKSNQKNKKLRELPYSERGLQYALSTKAVLGKNLMRKIQNEGTVAALEFCNLKAYALTDSMAVYHNATIKRVSDKPRNLKNSANTKELEYITIFKNDVKNNKESTPIVVESSKKISVYYPIKTNSMCLQCHGKPKTQIKENTFSALKKLYPNDKAVGYDINQVRGIWNVSFSKY